MLYRALLLLILAIGCSSMEAKAQTGFETEAEMEQMAEDNRRDANGNLTGREAVQLIVGDELDVETVNDDGTFTTFNGSTYRLYDGKAYLLDDDLNPVINPQPGTTANNANNVGIDEDGNFVPNTSPLNQAGRDLCAGCVVARAFLTGALNLADAMAQEVAQSARILTASMLIVWLFYHLVKLFMPFGMLEKASDIFNSIVTRIAFTMLVVVGLQSVDVYQRVLYGAIDAAIGLSGVILQQASGINQQVAEDIINSTADIERDTSIQSVYPQTGDPTTGLVASTNVDDVDIIRENMIESISDQVALVQATIGKPICAGLRLMLFEAKDCFAKDEEIYNNTAGQAFQGLRRLFRSARNAAVAVWQNSTRGAALLTAMASNPAETMASLMLNLISAILIVVVYGLIWIKYPLTILDLVVRWAILLVVWPVLVATLIFPALRGTTVVMLKGVGHAGLTMVFQAVIVGVIIAITEQIIVSYNLDEYVLFQGQKIEATYAFSSGPYLMVLISGFIMLHLINKAPDFAGIFIHSTMDTKVSDALFSKVSAFFWIAVQALPGGSVLNGVRKAIPIR